jgi:hypothetical protein
MAMNKRTPPEIFQPGWLSREKAAAYLNVSTRQFDRIRLLSGGSINARELPSTGFRRKLIRYKRTSLDDFMERMPFSLPDVRPERKSGEALAG